MQTRVLKLKLRRLNRAKTARLSALQIAFTEAVRFHLAVAVRLDTTSALQVHRACYAAARSQFALPASTLQQARDKALSAYRAYRVVTCKGRKTALPTFSRPLPLRLAVENLRVFPDKAVIRITTSDGFLWLPILIPERYHDLVRSNDFKKTRHALPQYDKLYLASK